MSASRRIIARRWGSLSAGRRRWIVASSLAMLASCSSTSRPALPASAPTDATVADTAAIASLARDLSHDTLLGRGPWTPENERVAHRLAAELGRLGAQPLLGEGLLVPFVAPERPADTVYNVVGLLPGRDGERTAELVGITAHFDHLGVGRPDSSGDSIYNGFLDAALPVAMVLDVARRYARSPGERPLVVMLFNLEEQGLLGSQALVERADAPLLIDRLQLLVGVDAGSPAGEATHWQLMGALPAHPGARLADSLARARGWTTTATPPRRISDVFSFSQRGVPILFPIPGAQWKGYSEAERADAMRRFDHYHQPSDEWRADFPLVGTAHFADWLWDIVRSATNARESLRP
jgi:Zn-dependent M28 family amino/carboxypeptidase